MSPALNSTAKLYKAFNLFYSIASYCKIFIVSYLGLNRLQRCFYIIGFKHIKNLSISVSIFPCHDVATPCYMQRVDALLGARYFLFDSSILFIISFVSPSGQGYLKKTETPNHSLSISFKICCTSTRVEYLPADFVL